MLVSALLARAADELPRGRVIERVTCAQAPAQAYAIFLPPNYDPARKWPLLLCLDPGANGRRDQCHGEGRRRAPGG